MAKGFGNFHGLCTLIEVPGCSWVLCPQDIRYAHQERLRGLKIESESGSFSIGHSTQVCATASLSPKTIRAMLIGHFTAQLNPQQRWDREQNTFRDYSGMPGHALRFKAWDPFKVVKIICVPVRIECDWNNNCHLSPTLVFKGRSSCLLMQVNLYVSKIKEKIRCLKKGTYKVRNYYLTCQRFKTNYSVQRF